jgi:hypothetical protein
VALHSTRGGLNISVLPFRDLSIREVMEMECDVRVCCVKDWEA